MAFLIAFITLAYVELTTFSHVLAPIFKIDWIYAVLLGSFITTLYMYIGGMHAITIVAIINLVVRYVGVGLALIIGGALGNQMDRLAAGEVLDFIKIPIWNGSLNVADIAINVGMILLLVSMIFSYFRPENPPDTEQL